MNITSSTSEGLVHTFQVQIPQTAIDAEINMQAEKLSKTVKMDGFRPGKVPVKMVRARYGQSLLGDAVEALVEKSTDELRKSAPVNSNNAGAPKVTVDEYKPDSGLTFSVVFETIPEITLKPFDKIKLERLTCAVADAEIEEMVSEFAQRFAGTRAIEKARKTKKDDIVLIDFLGKVDGVAFKGGEAQGHKLTLGSNSFIAGFEDQLIGHMPGAEVLVSVTFPEEYHSKELAGKAATFDVKIHEIHEKDVQINEELAQRMGLESVDKVRNLMRDILQSERDRIARLKLKRELLDQLAEAYNFELPPTMVEKEFETIWQQLQREMEETRARGDEVDLEGKTEDQVREEYRGIAQRRVRLGLLMGEIAKKNNIAVTQQEMFEAVRDYVIDNYQGYEKEAYEKIMQNPRMLTAIQAPVFEDKVVDFILTQTAVTERAVDWKTLQKEADGKVPMGND